LPQLGTAHNAVNLGGKQVGRQIFLLEDDGGTRPGV
jgi:hypothetical protein